MNFNNKNNVALLLIILGAIIFFVVVMPIVDKNYYNNQTTENFNTINTINNSNNDNLVKIDLNKCSTNCCGLSQWPVPSDMLDKSIPLEELKNYIPSNFGCTSGNYSGCVCLTQQDSNYLNNHGNNSHNS